jgi:acetyl-CoA carboxylase biotin carboxyl carrier protein
MDLKVISELIKMVSESRLTSLEVQERDFRVKLEKGYPNKLTEEIGADRSVTIEASDKSTDFDKESYIKVNSDKSEFNETQKDKEEKVESSDLKVVKSPIVGTFYASASPDSEPFVTKGKKIKKGETLCIIEAMKLMNEIECEFDGEVVEILVENASMVEYGQPLFKIK